MKTEKQLIIHDFYFCNFSLPEYLFDELWVTYIGWDKYA